MGGSSTSTLEDQWGQGSLKGHRTICVGHMYKYAVFDTPPSAIVAAGFVLYQSPLWMIPLEFRRDIWRQKTRVPGLSCGIICVILRLAVLIQYRSVTDRQTDTRRRHLPRYHSVGR